jgi:hypothetical protein
MESETAIAMDILRFANDVAVVPTRHDASCPGFGQSLHRQLLLQVGVEGA